MRHPADRIAHTTAFVAPDVEHWLEQDIAQWVHHERPIRQPTSERSYHGDTSRSFICKVLIMLALMLLSYLYSATKEDCTMHINRNYTKLQIFSLNACGLRIYSMHSRVR